MLTVHARTETSGFFRRVIGRLSWTPNPWRSLRILAEFVEGFDALAAVGKAVTIFGSARTPESDPYYTLRRASWPATSPARVSPSSPARARHHGGRKPRLPRGGRAFEGCNIELPHEQSVNQWVDLGVEFRYFFAARRCSSSTADGFAIFPGGFGTLDELFEVADTDPGRARSATSRLSLSGPNTGPACLLDAPRGDHARGHRARRPGPSRLHRRTWKEACKRLTAGSTRRARRRQGRQGSPKRRPGPGSAGSARPHRAEPRSFQIHTPRKDLRGGSGGANAVGLLGQDGELGFEVALAEARGIVSQARDAGQAARLDLPGRRLGFELRARRRHGEW